MKSPLTVKVTNNKLIISIGIDTLAWAASNVPDNGLWKDGSELIVLNSKEFADNMAIILQQEEEDGTTPVHILLENAMREVAEQGYLSVDIKEDGYDS